jgi:hypothetical protein
MIVQNGKVWSLEKILLKYQRMGEQLYIPSFIVRAAGFLAGDKAFVTDDDPVHPEAKPVCVLLKEKPSKPLCDCIVSKDCHILVTMAMLKNCGLKADDLEIDTQEGKIVVKRSKSD